MVLGMKDFKNYEKFLVMYVIVKLSSLKYAGIECDQVNFLFFYYNQKYSCESIF